MWRGKRDLLSTQDTHVNVGRLRGAIEKRTTHYTDLFGAYPLGCRSCPASNLKRGLSRCFVAAAGHKKATKMVEGGRLINVKRCQLFC